MTDKLRPLRGMKDLLPEDYKVHDFIIKKAREIGELYGYKPMSTPKFHESRLCSRTKCTLRKLVLKFKVYILIIEAIYIINKTELDKPK